jgi:hypothetical protein
MRRASGDPGCPGGWGESAVAVSEARGEIAVAVSEARGERTVAVSR